MHFFNNLSREKSPNNLFKFILFIYLFIYFLWYQKVYRINHVINQIKCFDCTRFAFSSHNPDMSEIVCFLMHAISVYVSIEHITIYIS